MLPILVPLPPLTEQHRIAARIETIATKIAEAQKLKEETKKDFETLLAAMAHRNDLTEQQKIFQGWDKIKLGEVISLARKPETVSSEKSYKGLGIYSYGKGCFKKIPISGENIKAKLLYKGNYSAAEN